MTIDESNQAQADFWETAGPTWVALRDRFEGQAGRHGVAAIEALDPRAGERIVDIGCGAGNTTIEIARRVGRDGSAIGLDISGAMIAGATELKDAVGSENVDFVVGDAMAHDFDGSFDACFSRFGVMFFSDATAGFTNLRAALRPGGRMAFVCWQAPDRNPWISAGMALVSQYVELPFSGDPTAPGPLSLADPERIGTVLDGADFTDVEITPHETPARIGDDPDDAATFMSDLMPPIGMLGRSDPEKAKLLRVDLVELMTGWDTGDGVQSPSATWIVTATNPT